MRVLSIDPGYDRCGVAVIEKEQKETLIFSDCILTDKKRPTSERIFEIGNVVESLIKEYSPTACALEKLYFGNNQKTATSVAEVRGVILFLAHTYKLAVFEYTPQEVKVAVTGYGKSDKSSVMAMVPRLVTIDKKISYDDEFDAIAVGLTCLAHQVR